MSADEGAWEWARSFDTGVDGRFELRGPPRRGTVALQAVALGYTAISTDQVGRELVIRLRGEGAPLALEVRIDAGIPRSWLEIVLIDPSGHEVTGSLREESTVVFEDCAPHAHVLEVRTADGAWTVERLEGVRPLAALDGRLAPLDLTGRFDLAPLVLRDRDGAALADVAVAARIEPWGSGRRRLRTDHDGRLTLLVPRGCREIELAPEGFTPLALGWLPGEQVLTFSRP
jgi:hypothetical protein